MSEAELKAVADAADIIVNGYAFSVSEDCIRVLNLGSPSRAAVLSSTGEVLETSMDGIELSIVNDYFRRNREFLAA